MDATEQEAADIGAIAEIEEILEAASTAPVGRPAASLGGAVWFCACDSFAVDSPTWVIEDGPTPGTLVWQRLPEVLERVGVLRRLRRRAVSVSEVVDLEQVLAWGHVRPTGLRDWLHGADDIAGYVDGDTGALERLRRLCASR